MHSPSSLFGCQRPRVRAANEVGRAVTLATDRGHRKIALQFAAMGLTFLRCGDFGMRWTRSDALRLGAILLALTLGFALTPTEGVAQGLLAGLGESHTVTTVVTVKSVDITTRHIVVAGPAGEIFSLKAPVALPKFTAIKPGDTIKATYTWETEFALSAPNAPLPSNTETTIAAKSESGELPAGLVANHVVVTGTILAIDAKTHTLKLADPRGGQVHAIHVRNPDRQKALARLKVGDTITAYLSESLLLSVKAK
jgi:hypothetical protein